jgi:hypothetical protein
MGAKCKKIFKIGKPFEKKVKALLKAETNKKTAE